MTDSATDARVFGEATRSGGTGILGTNANTTGTGVSGLGQTGVHGQPLSGGTGVVAAAAQDGTGTALHALGLAQFDSTTQFALSGLASVVANGRSLQVAGVSLRSGSLVIATLQNDVGVWVESAVPDVAGSKITINLNKAVPAGKTAKVAWFIIN